MSSDQKVPSAAGGGGCCGPKDHDNAATDKASTKSAPAVTAKPGDKEPVPKGAAAKSGSGHCH